MLEPDFSLRNGGNDALDDALGELPRDAGNVVLFGAVACGIELSEEAFRLYVRSVKGGCWSLTSPSNNRSCLL
jgi:hypothetical protein